jgi:hypothetical protein
VALLLSQTIVEAVAYAVNHSTNGNHGFEAFGKCRKGFGEAEVPMKSGRVSGRERANGCAPARPLFMISFVKGIIPQI